MNSTINKSRLTNLLRGMQKSIDLFASQGYSDVYFTAQFIRGGRKQNGIERGDVAAFSTQIRTYVSSEEADSVRVEFFDDSTGKSIYSKVMSDLRSSDEKSGEQSGNNGLGGTNGLGEIEFNALVDKRVDAKEREKDYVRMGKELDDIRTKYAALESEKEELEATVKAKKDIEFYTGIIGAAFPGLAPLFNGTPLAQAAGFLAGTSDLNGNAITAKETSEEASSISALVSEFCSTLNTQEAGTMHILFMMFEKDKSQIQRALQLLTTNAPATP